MAEDGTARLLGTLAARAQLCSVAAPTGNMLLCCCRRRGCRLLEQRGLGV